VFKPYGSSNGLHKPSVYPIPQYLLWFGIICEKYKLLLYKPVTFNISLLPAQKESFKARMTKMFSAPMQNYKVKR
jgi:hypothetical protein